MEFARQLKRNEGSEIFLVFLLKIISWAFFLDSGLKLIFQWKAQILILYKSLSNSFAEVSTLWITENEDVSSTNNFPFDDRPSARLLI